MPPLSRRLVLTLAGSTPLLAACAGSQPTDGAATQSQTPVQLTYLHQWSPTQGHGPITDTLVARWNQENPTTTITGTYTAMYYEKLAAILAAGDFPDIITYNLSFVPLLVKKGVVVPVETLSKGSARININDLVPAAREMATFDGKLMIAPAARRRSDEAAHHLGGVSRPGEAPHRHRQRRQGDLGHRLSQGHR